MTFFGPSSYVVGISEGGNVENDDYYTCIVKRRPHETTTAVRTECKSSMTERTRKSGVVCGAGTEYLPIWKACLVGGYGPGCYIIPGIYVVFCKTIYVEFDTNL